MYPTDLAHLKNIIEKRHRVRLREQLIVAYNSHDKENTQKLLDELQDHDESYINRPYDKSGVELFKQQVMRNRAFAN